MRRTLGLVLLASVIGALVGCFTTDKKLEPVGPIGPPTGEKEPTLEYWNKVREVMRLKTTSSDMRQVAAIVQRQADAVRQLPIQGVDKDLYVAALAVAQNQDKELKTAEAAGYSPAALRADPELRKSYSDASQQVTAAITRLKALAPTLSARYGAPFAPIEDQ
jgi:hypothetical protein